VNVLSRGDRVLCGDNGKFGERWVKLAKAYGLDVQVIRADWGQPLDPEAFRAALEADTARAIRAVILTHSETSTGVINDLETIAGHVRGHGTALTIADCVTSLGACDVPMDAWGLDVVGSGSQKGYMIPPGLAFVAMSERAWSAQERSDLPKFYLDLAKYRKAAAQDSTPFTPPVNLYFALEAALTMMQEEGLKAIFARHDRHRRRKHPTRHPNGCHELGLDQLLPGHDPGCPNHAVRTDRDLRREAVHARRVDRTHRSPGTARSSLRKCRAHRGRSPRGHGVADRIAGHDRLFGRTRRHHARLEHLDSAPRAGGLRHGAQCQERERERGESAVSEGIRENGMVHG
jgi:aspartate aminotransferase-like enzyme